MDPQPITVYNVVNVSQCIGTRIEAYTNKHTWFTNKDKALAFATKLVEKIREEYASDEDSDSDEELTIDLADGFRIDDHHYHWAHAGVYIEELTMDLSKDQIISFQTSDW